jgi:hypothetical protein
MKLEDMLEGPAGPGIIRRAVDILRRVQKLQSNDTHKTQTQDSVPTLPKNSEALKSVLYATEINQAGARMRRQKDCRPSLRRSAKDGEPEIIGPSQQQRLDAFKAGEAYALQCRSRWRKG